jgi:predicted nucleotidyltransferase component of viral defense system
MLSDNQIEEISRTLTNGNRGHAEKLYLQDLILSTISRETVDELIFKGGTALLKFYQLDRFSEDLDFTKNGEINLEKLLEKIVRDLENFGAEVEKLKTEETERSFKARLGIQGPLYMGEERSLCFIRIEINKKSSVRDVETQRYNPRFQDITSFELPVMTQKEILSEKIRAIATRDKPRDLYDAYHLLSKGVAIETDLVQDKLDYYEISYSKEEIISEARKLEKNWEMLTAFIYSSLPEFEEVILKLEEELPEN